MFYYNVRENDLNNCSVNRCGCSLSALFYRHSWCVRDYEIGELRAICAGVGSFERYITMELQWDMSMSNGAYFEFKILDSEDEIGLVQNITVDP